MKDTLMLYAVLLGKRFTRKQKLTFYQIMKERYEKQGWPVRIQNKKVAVGKLNHIVIGDVKKAKMVLMTSYDTPSKVWLPNFLYFPFQWSQNKKQEYQNMIFKSVIAIAAMAGMLACFYNLLLVTKAMRWIRMILGVLLGAGAYMASKDSANIVNMNRCSASLALLDELAQQLKDEPVAIVLLDRSVSAATGYMALEDLLSQHSKILFLDALANGKELFCASSKSPGHFPNGNVKPVRADESEVPLLRVYPQAVILTLGEVQDAQIVVKYTRTKQDYEINIEQLQEIQALCLAYIKEELI